MNEFGYMFCFIFIIIVVHLYTVSGELIPNEQLHNKTTCDLLNVVVSCDSADEFIAVDNIYFYYKATCETICCTFNDHDSSHSNVSAIISTVQEVRRLCSGTNTCTLDMSGTRAFQSVGTHEPSYVLLQYYCIPSSRRTPICSSTSLTSAGEPLYLTSNNYPSVTTGNSTCSCSLEVYSCTSSINLYVLDADLYYNTATCEQSIDILDGRNASLKEIKCENYYNNEIDKTDFNTNYIKIDFIDGSAQNQEGLFFLGFAVTETVAFNISCSFIEQTVCRECGPPGFTSHGSFVLATAGESGYGSLANVVCDNGYESDKSNISCLNSGEWETATCSPKDCGTPYGISNGNISAVVSGSTTFGARATVLCDEGFEVKGLCRNDEFQCGDGACILSAGKCDNSPDCDDELDEKLCDAKACLEGQVLCGSTCIDADTTCEDGGTTHTISSDGTIGCLVIGVWERVQCSLKDCGDLADIKNGSVTLTVTGLTTYQSTAAVSCDDGFAAVSETIVCQANGTWETASCVPDCGNPTINNGSVTLDVPDKTTYLATATISCNPGFDKSSEAISCQLNGSWEYASCVIKDCEGFSTISNGSIDLDIPGKTTYLATATVSCESGFDKSSESIECQASGEWQSAACVIRDCGEPYSIANGSINVDVTGKTTYLSTATVTCDSGYDESMPSISCEANGVWQTASCVIKDCGEPGSIANGSINVDVTGKTTYLSTATVTCDSGYDESMQFISCEANGVWQTASCVIKDCGEPGSIANGSIKVDVTGKTTYPSTATVTCDSGYDESMPSVSCEANGVWQTASCVIKDCGNLYVIVNGSINVDVPGKTTYLSTATVSCDLGYDELDASIICQANGSWQVTTCNIKDCGDPGSIANGSINVDATGKTTYLSTATVTCDSGYDESMPSISCEANGVWQTALCVIKDCGDLYAIANGSINADVPGKTTYLSTATVSCDLGYDELDASIICQANGTWQVTTCNIKDCGEPGSIANGSIKVDVTGKTTYLSTATVTCDSGYDESMPSISCEANGVWQTASCVIKDCGDLYVIDNGNIAADVSGKTTYLSTATVSCDLGYDELDASIVCQANGTWQVTTCDIKDCGAAKTIDNGTITLEDPGSTIYLSIARVLCDEGFNASTSSVSCLESGTWQNATCVIKDCGSFGALANGSINLDVDGKTTYLSTASVSCVSGYHATTDEILCQADGNWESVHCVITECGKPSQISFGKIVLNKEDATSFVSTATVVCITGYTATQSIITCQANGSWEISTCEMKDCGALNVIVNGNITLDDNGSTQYLSTATVSCDDGFNASTSSVSCQASGSWQNASCDIKDCGATKTIYNGTITLDDQDTSTYLSTATVSCYEGFNASLSSVLCQASGFWQYATCNIKDCGTVKMIDNGNITLDDPGTSTYLSIATVLCDQGFDASASSISCQANGSWPDASCDIKDCEVTHTIQNGTITLDDPSLSTYLSTATVSCDEGFGASISTVSCQASGSWEDASCDIKDCGNTNTIANGTISEDISGKTTYLSSATVKCDPGFDETPLSISCQASGKWQDTSCKIKDCGIPTQINNGTTTLDKSGETTYLSKATVSCEPGFDVVFESISCLSNGSWQVAFCFIKDLDCGLPPDLDNGKITLSRDGMTTVGSIAVVSCNKGYNKSVMSVTCLETALWQQASCVIVDCGNPPIVLHGVVDVLDGSFTTYDSVAYLTCHEGYRAEQQFVACKETGEWESSSCTPENRDDDIFIILAATGGVVILLLLIIMVMITLKCKSARSADFHQRHIDKSTRGSHSLPTRSTVYDDLDDDLDDVADTVEGRSITNGDDWRLYPEQEHVMSPNEINIMEERVFGNHEPHMWHPDMHRHLEGRENGWDFNHRF